MVGMRDVAKRAGVSVSTVSLVVNRTGYVSDAMRERVEKAMRELSYIPNELARNLYHDRTNLIGLIVPTIRHPFFAELTIHIQHALAQRGLHTMLCSTHDEENGEATYVDMLRRHMMDGIIMCAHTAHDPDYWTSINRPIVAFDRYIADGIPSIGSDHEQGGRIVADLLIRSGAKHVVMVGGPREQFYDRVDASGTRTSTTTFPTVRYYMTLEKLLSEAGIHHEYVAAGDVSEMAEYGKAMHWVCERVADGAFGGETIDAVVSSDLGAAYCVQEALRMGLEIPDQLQVISYDGTYIAHTAGMRITTVAQDLSTLGTLLVEQITQSINRQHTVDNKTADNNKPAENGIAGNNKHIDHNNIANGTTPIDIADSNNASPSATSELDHDSLMSTTIYPSAFNHNAIPLDAASVPTLMDVLVPVTLQEGETTK